MDVPALAVPALIALIAKAALFFYARSSEVRNLETRLYLLFLFALAVQNLAEVSGFISIAYTNSFPEFDGYVYFAASIPAIALLLHLALVLGAGDRARFYRPMVGAIYLLVLLLECLLLFTPWLVQGFQPENYSYSKIPGPLYSLFEIYAVGALVTTVGLLIYGALRQANTHQKLKNRLMLLGIAPIFIVVIAVIGLQHIGGRQFNATVTLPIAVTFFLAVTAYATHQYRLFDIAFYIPWSKVRARKTAFYNRIRAMIAEIADLGSVREATHRLSETLGCSVALVSTGKPVLAVAGAAQQMVAFPLESLRRIDRIVVANEVADRDPATYRLMQNHGVAAIVPFYPHSHSASGWMLLGDAFSEQVYTPLDFKMVEQLFDKMAELFLDKLLAMRTQLAAAERRLQATELRLQEAEAGTVTLRGEVESLRAQNQRLVREQAADSLVASSAPEHGTLPGIVLLGRDKPLLKRLRRHFPQADQYVGPDSASFRRQNPPDVLICRLEADRGADDDWFSLLTQGQSAALLYGAGTRDFIAAHIEQLAGAFIEVMPEDATDEALERRIRALAHLRRATRVVSDPDCPLIGASLAFHETLRDVARLAGFAEPLLIESRDARETAVVARYLHTSGARPGAFRVHAARDAADRFGQILAECAGGTLLLSGLEALAPAARDNLIAMAMSANETRTILSIDAADEVTRARFQSFTLRLPSLRERRQDLPLLVHYFTLQYNLRAGTNAYLTQAEVDDLMAEHYPEDMDALRATVFGRLNARHRAVAPAPEMDVALTDKTLEEHVAAFEARLIEQTLERCQGNKSKAARQLGLRPNTLHYKLERYGLGGGTKTKDD